MRKMYVLQLDHIYDYMPRNSTLLLLQRAQMIVNYLSVLVLYRALSPDRMEKTPESNIARARQTIPPLKFAFHLPSLQFSSSIYLPTVP